MALDERIAFSLYDQMLEVVTGRDPEQASLPSAFDSDTTKLVMAQRGLVIRADDYRNPWTPGNTDGRIDATESIAQLVDDIPGSSNMFSPTGRKVSQVYSHMVEGVKVTEPPPSEDIQRRRDEANKVLVEEAVDDEGRKIQRPTLLADQEERAANAYKDAYMAYVSAWANAQANEDLRRMWPMTGAQLVQGPKRAFADWGAAGRDQIRTAKAQLATLNTGQVARAFAEAQWRLNAYRLVNEASGETFLRTQISPSDWAGSDARDWPEYSMSQSTFKSEFSAEATSWGAEAGIMVGMWSFGGGAASESRQERMSEETTDIGITFRWRVCPVRRPWMDATLFSLPNWDVGALAGAGGISGGPSPLMSLVPVALVIVRDIDVRAAWSSRDSERIDEAIQGSVSVGWGPFGVKGNYSHSSSNEKYSAERTAQGFRIPDMQVLGFVCVKVPHCPPK